MEVNRKGGASWISTAIGQKFKGQITHMKELC